MVEKSIRKRQLTPGDWAALEHMRLAGMSVADIAARAGLSESWTYRKLARLAADPADVRQARQRRALDVELARIHVALGEEKPLDVERRAKAFSAVVKASKDLEGMMTYSDVRPDTPDEDEPSLEEMRAELHRRLNRIRADIEAKRVGGRAEPAGDPRGSD